MTSARVSVGAERRRRAELAEVLGGHGPCKVSALGSFVNAQIAESPSMIEAKGWMTIAHGMWIMTWVKSQLRRVTVTRLPPRLTVVDLLEEQAPDVCRVSVALTLAANRSCRTS